MADLTNLTDEQLAERGYAQEALVRAEFLRRQTIAMRESADHQRRAADAMADTARATAEAAGATKNTVDLLRQSGDDQKRVADAMIVTAQATKDAANAAKETAEATRDNARYMFWSVIVVAATSGLNLIVTLFHHSK